MAPIVTPDGTEVEEVILPDGSEASEVIAPDGTVVFDAIPDNVVAYGGRDDNTYVHDVSDGSLVQTLTEAGNDVRAVA